MFKRWISLLLALMLALSASACALEEQIAENMDLTSRWIDSDLTGVILEDTQIRLQDDFAAAVNKDWKLEIGDSYHNVLQEITDTTLQNMETAVADPSIEGPEAECLRTYYGLASSWDDRNADGIEPLKPYIEDIASIDSREAMFEFLSDPRRNPLFIAPAVTGLPMVFPSGLYKDRYTVYLCLPDLSLADYFSFESAGTYESYKQVRRKASYMLERLGYTKKEAGDLIDRCMVYEKSLAEADESASITDLDDITWERAEALELAGDYPLDQILRGWGFEDTPYISLEPQFASRLSGLCSQGKLEDLKACLIVHYALMSADYLDREAHDTMTELSRDLMREEENYNAGIRDPEKSLIFDTYIGQSPMIGAMNRVYVENFFDDDCISELYGLTEDLINAYREVFTEEDWLSEEGKKACIEKLDAIKIHIACQDFDSVDYGDLQLKSHAEGGSFLEACYAAKIFEMEHAGRLSAQPYDPSYWDPLRQDTSTTITNACYMPANNSIYIFAGICEAPVYSRDMTYEEKMAGLSVIVGHEITHGFDMTGAQYDRDGQKETWLPMEDQMKFNDRNDKVAAYYSTLKPFAGSGLYAGSAVCEEATADMGGLRLALHIAKEKSEFDYDRFFRAFARDWRKNVPMEVETRHAKGDVHPLAFYRINVGLQQFEKFYETYGIREGDGMYLEPEKRISVW